MSRGFPYRGPEASFLGALGINEPVSYRNAVSKKRHLLFIKALGRQSSVCEKSETLHPTARGETSLPSFVPAESEKAASMKAPERRRVRRTTDARARGREHALSHRTPRGRTSTSGDTPSDPEARARYAPTLARGCQEDSLEKSPSARDHERRRGDGEHRPHGERRDGGGTREEAQERLERRQKRVLS